MTQFPIQADYASYYLSHSSLHFHSCCHMPGLHFFKSTICRGLKSVLPTIIHHIPLTLNFPVSPNHWPASQDSFIYDLLPLFSHMFHPWNQTNQSTVLTVPLLAISCLTDFFNDELHIFKNFPMFLKLRSTLHSRSEENCQLQNWQRSYEKSPLTMTEFIMSRRNQFISLSLQLYIN